jgi:hypothetical protein
LTPGAPTEGLVEAARGVVREILAPPTAG